MTSKSYTLFTYNVVYGSYFEKRNTGDGRQGTTTSDNDDEIAGGVVTMEDNVVDPHSQVIPVELPKQNIISVAVLNEQSQLESGSEEGLITMETNIESKNETPKVSSTEGTEHCKDGVNCVHQSGDNADNKAGDITTDEQTISHDNSECNWNIVGAERDEAKTNNDQENILANIGTTPEYIPQSNVVEDVLGDQILSLCSRTEEELQNTEISDSGIVGVSGVTSKIEEITCSTTENNEIAKFQVLPVDIGEKEITNECDSLSTATVISSDSSIVIIEGENSKKEDKKMSCEEGETSVKVHTEEKVSKKGRKGRRPSIQSTRNTRSKGLPTDEAQML